MLLIEGMAQTAGALCVMAKLGGAKPPLVYFMTIDKAKFRKPVMPGDRVEFHMTRSTSGATSGGIKARRWLTACLVAEAEISAMIITDARQRRAELVSIHPTSIVEDGARLGAGVEIGPFCHIGPRVMLGDGVTLKSHARGQRPHDHRPAHEDLSLRLDRLRAAGSEISRRGH